MGTKQQPFCDTNIRPWIIITIALGIITVIWATFSRDELFRRRDRDTLARQNQVFHSNSPVPTNPQLVAHQMPVNPQNMMLNAITRATPQGGVQLVRGTMPIAFQDVFKNAIRAIEPSVVDIHAICINKRILNKRNNTNPNNPQFTNPFTGNADRFIGRRPYENIGAGFIVDSRGYVVTNYHVVENASSIIVAVTNPQTKDYRAKVVMTSPALDVAVLKILSTDIFPVSPIGDSTAASIGDWVIAIGSPFGLDMSVTAGIISGIRKSITIDGNVYNDLIQTDTPINKGNSGGPLANLNGEVIGITTAIYAPTGVFNGTGFAIPINPVKQFLRDAIGPNTPGLTKVAFNMTQPTDFSGIGLEVIPVNSVMAREFRLPVLGGVAVNNVLPGSPADEAGFLRGDVITSMGGVSLMNAKQLPNVLQRIANKRRIEVTYYRNGQEADALITLR